MNKQRVTILHVTVISHHQHKPEEIIEELMEDIIDKYDTGKIQLITSTIEVKE